MYVIWCTYGRNSTNYRDRIKAPPKKKKKKEKKKESSIIKIT